MHRGPGPPRNAGVMRCWAQLVWHTEAAAQINRENTEYYIYVILPITVYVCFCGSS